MSFPHGGGGRGEAAAGNELVLVSVPGVQQFIEETRSVSDVRAASEIYSELTAKIVDACGSAGGEVIFPSGPTAPGGMPNRVVATFPPGIWEGAAPEVQSRVEGTWRGWVREALRLTNEPVPETPGMPGVQWVCVPSDPGGYQAQWDAAQRLMAARRRVRDFQATEWRQRTLCSVGPRWPAEPEPRGLKEHEKVPLSAAGWVKRRWRDLKHLDGFPSTSSIASAPFRQAVLDRLGERQVFDAVSELRRIASDVIRMTQGGDVIESPVPGLTDPQREPGKWFASTGGPWVYPDRWQADSLARESKADVSALRPLVDRGLDAARHLTEVMGKRDVPSPANYLAIIVQDLDDMGLFLSGRSGSAAGDLIEVSSAKHREVSARLRTAGEDQRRVLESPAVLGLPVYAGGDDLLGFVPAVHALAAAQGCHDALPPTLPTASTAVCFFHYHASLRDALAGARDLLHAAKDVDRKHGLGVGYLRRSGVSETSVQPWTPGASATISAFGVFAGYARYRLSPGLLTDLERDRDELARLSDARPDVYRAELTRLIGRHMADDPPAAEVAKVSDAISRLGAQESAMRPPGAPRDGAWPLPAAKVAVFLRQEAR